eukprot:TRINITY_DN3682_c0_g1_i3.p2 TRINITY_DN3682_c0_g1~~TRINITY_DN3682_c0_g1_i3.p2  ORF type:complete len:259 (-),score=64.66 TRINITY_DN3682_c0_g1_i3:735-1511(-)
MCIRDRIVTCACVDFSMPRLAQLCTWNVWGIPLGAPLLHARSARWRSWFEQAVPQPAPGSLEVLCLQEAFRWRVGPLGWLCCAVAAAFQSALGGWETLAIVCLLPLSVLCLLACVLTHWVPPRWQWDMKHCWAGSERLPHLLGGHGASMCARKQHRMLDSGLAILASHAPSEWGFEPFQVSSEWYSECGAAFWKKMLSKTELLANKGLLWGCAPSCALLLCSAAVLCCVLLAVLLWRCVLCSVLSCAACGTRMKGALL